MFKKTTLTVLILLNLIILYKSDAAEIAGGQRNLADFDIYYKLTNDLKSGINPYTVSYMTTPAPPVVFLYFLPFSYMSLESARSLSTIINIVSGFLLCLILSKMLFKKHQLIVFLFLSSVYFSAFPTRFALILGQPLLISTLLITLIFHSTHRYLKILFFTLLISIKSYFALSLLSYVKKDIKIVIWVGLLLFAISALLMFFVNPEAQKYYAGNTFWDFLLNTALPVGTDYYNQSFKSTINRLYLGELFIPLYFIFLIYSLYTVFKSRNFLKSVILSVLISPVLWQHYFTLIFPVIVYILRYIKINPKTATFIFLGIFFWWAEFPGIHYSNLNFLTRILASHYFLSAVIFLKLSDYSSSST